MVAVIGPVSGLPVSSFIVVPTGTLMEVKALVEGSVAITSRSLFINVPAPSVVQDPLAVIAPLGGLLISIM